MSSRPVCRICEEEVHIMKSHLKKTHGLNGDQIDVYFNQHPNDPRLSKVAIDGAKIMKANKKKTSSGGQVALNELFELGDCDAGRTKSGKDLMIPVLDEHQFQHLVPEFDSNYIFNVDILKTCLMGLSINARVYLYGHSGTGKTTYWENICAKTNRPLLRSQHSINVEESHIIGQWVARPRETPDGSVITVTEFQPGPLALAMKHGWVYQADEYDRIHPTVASVYQSVMEGKALSIKEADDEWRLVEPHPDFRFVGTGNSNGSGDETGLYQAVITQDAANFERWDIVEHVGYLPRDSEIAVVTGQAGLRPLEAEKVVDFCRAVRGMFPDEISLTPGPRVAIRIGRLGVMKSNFNKAVELTFANRLPEAEKVATMNLAQRYFG
jgi:cobaltochelatase CobS